MELRGHEHVVECVNWAPDVALPHVADACGIEVSTPYSRNHFVIRTLSKVPANWIQVIPLK